MKILDTLIINFLFADVCALVALKEEDLQDLANNLSRAGKSFGLTINLKKTYKSYAGQHQASLSKHPTSNTIELTKLDTIESFT